MVKKFIVHLMNGSQGAHKCEVNCANEDQAKGIAEGLFSKAQVVGIEEVK